MRASLRTLAGRVRTRARRAADRRLIVASGLVDPEWVGAQLGLTLSAAEEAADAYLDADGDCSPHPLFVAEYIDRMDGVPPEGANPLVWYLTNPAVHRKHTPHPLLDVQALGIAKPDLVERPGGPVAAWLATAEPSTPLPGPVGAPASTWAQVRAAAFAGLRSWQSRDAAPEAAQPAASSVVLVARPPVRPLFRSLFTYAGAGHDLVVVAAGQPRWRHVLVVTVATRAGGRVVSLTDGDPAAAGASGVEAAVGRSLVLSLGVSGLGAPEADRLVAHLDTPGIAAVQPVLLSPAGSVASAGAVFEGDDVDPRPLLHDHSPRDLEGLGLLELPAAYGEVLAVRGDDLREVGGLDVALGARLAVTDLSLRLRKHGRVLLDPAVRVTGSNAAPVDDAGLLDELDRRHHPAPGGSAALLEATAIPPRAERLAETPPALRWTIDLSSPPGGLGEIWGDTHFGRSLAASLERLGQHVAVDNAAQRARQSRDHDDVLLVIHGPDAVPARPGLANLLWVISHPETVTAEDARGYDRVFGASLTWPARIAAAWSVPAEPLLQCTDPALFNPGRAEPGAAGDVLFVGNTRGHFRDAVRYAVAAGADLDVHGAGWEPLVPPGTVRSRFVPNDQLGRLYASAGIVLCDHFAEMRDDGFLANRLFDAAACGARIASDDIAGVRDVFGDQVQVFRDGADLRRILEDRDQLYPAPEELLSAAARVAEQHSFDARAATLLDAAVRSLRH